MSVTLDILASYKAPRRVMRRLLAEGQREDRALVILMVACGLIFVSQWPCLARLAFLYPDVPLQARIGAALFAWGCLAPILMYCLAAISHIIALICGGKGSWFSARLALFWSLLCVAPLWLLHGLGAGFIGASLGLSVLGFIIFVLTLAIWGASLYEAEQTQEAQTAPGDLAV
ncbi:MAG: YIP1 family protein [Mangrovicoccus sp.]